MCKISHSRENAKRNFSVSPINLFNLENSHFTGGNSQKMSLQEILRTEYESQFYPKEFSAVKIYIFWPIGYNYPHLFYQLPCEFNAQTSIQVN
jgi:hypothetical protein